MLDWNQIREDETFSESLKSSVLKRAVALRMARYGRSPNHPMFVGATRDLERIAGDNRHFLRPHRRRIG